MLSRRHLVPAGILIAGVALTWQSRSQSAVPLARALETVMPRYENYSVTSQTLSVEEQRVAGMSNYVARVYRRDSAAVFTTLVAYYDRQTHGKTIHSPRNCLPGAGWEIVSTGVQVVPTASGPRTVNRYLIRNGRSTALAYYWYQGRGRITANEYAVKWNLLRDAAFAGHTEEALVRVIVPVSVSQNVTEQQAQQNADGQATAVARRLIDEVGQVLPKSPSA
jgi:EpsI family protein